MPGNDLISRAPDFVRWMSEPHILVGLLLLSASLFVLSLVGVPWFLARMPADYFSRHERGLFGFDPTQRPAWYVALKVMKNLGGITLVLVGLAMLILPGQGILTMFVGLMLLDFPGKRRIQRRILSIRSVYHGVNALRRRAGQPPLIILREGQRRRGPKEPAPSKT